MITIPVYKTDVILYIGKAAEAHRKFSILENHGIRSRSEFVEDENGNETCYLLCAIKDAKRAKEILDL